MGAAAPLLFFTDHDAKLNRLLKEGRRASCRFRRSRGLEKILDCQSEQTSSPARSTGLSEIAGGMP